MKTKQKIRNLYALMENGAVTVDEVQSVVGGDRREVQRAMRQLDDDGFLLMKNGYYRLSEHAKSDLTKGD